MSLGIGIMYGKFLGLASALALGVFCVAALGVAPAGADPVYFTGEFDCVGAGCAEYVDHQDAEPFAGWVYLTLENTGSEAWGDFHFEIYQVPGNEYPIENVHFLEGTGFDPTSSQAPLSWDIDNDVVGATIDLFFDDDPVLPGEIATFNVYTDNIDDVPYFGVLFYPTPIPEPSTTVLLVAAGLVGWAIRGRRRSA